MADFKVHGIRLEAGYELLDAVRDAFGRMSISFCDVIGFGELKWVELQVGDQGEGQVFEGPLQLIDFKGRLRQVADVMLDEYVCTVSRLTDNGVQVLGGKLKEAEIEYVELTFVPVDTVEVSIPAVEDGVSKAVKTTINARSPTKSALPDRWAKAVLESKRIQRVKQIKPQLCADILDLSHAVVEVAEYLNRLGAVIHRLA